MTDYLIDARIAMEYATGAILVFIFGQYFVRYGYKSVLLFCTVGSFVTHIFIQICLVYPDTLEPYFTFLAATPLILSGGDILFMALVCSQIGTNSTGKSNRRWRFFLFEFYVVVPEILSKSFMITWPQNNSEPVLSYTQFYCLILSFIAIVQTLFYRDEVSGEYQSHPYKQRIQSSMNFNALRETSNCFNRDRPSEARKQLLLSFLIFATTAIYSTAFSDVRLTFMSRVHGWTLSKFVTTTSIAMLIGFLVASLAQGILSFFLRPIDPSVFVVGIISAFFSQLLIAAAYYEVYFYYGALSLYFFTILGRVALKSHFCQLVEKHEFAPLFGMAIACERTIRILMSLVWKCFISLTPNQTILYWAIVFIAQSMILMIPLLAGLTLLYITKIHGYPYYALFNAEHPII